MGEKREIDLEKYLETTRAEDGRRANDGVWIGACTTTRIYCRTMCPAVGHVNLANVKVFTSPAAAERAGFRPCLTCAPEEMPRPSVEAGFSKLAVAWDSQVKNLIEGTAVSPDCKIRDTEDAGHPQANAQQNEISQSDSQQSYARQNEVPTVAEPLECTNGAKRHDTKTASHLPDSVVISTACAELDVSTDQIAEVVSEQFGVTAEEYVATARRLFAKHLLRTTAMPLDEVAIASGFANANALQQEFRTHYRLDAAKLASQKPQRPRLSRK